MIDYNQNLTLNFMKLHFCYFLKVVTLIIDKINVNLVSGLT